MTDDEVGSLADELRLLAVTLTERTEGGADELLALTRERVSGAQTGSGDEPDVERIEIT